MTGPDVHPGEMFENDPQLAAFAHDLRAAADAVPAPAVGDDLAAVLAGVAPAPAPAWLPRRRRSHRSITLRVTIAGAAFGLGVGSLGVAGALPDPVQHRLSHAGDVVGVHLPDPADDHAAANDPQGRDQEQQQAPGIRVVRPTTPAARNGAGNDDESTTSTTARDNGKHLGNDQGEHGDDRGEQERTEHATTTTVDGHGDGGHDGNGGGDDGGSAHVENVTTTTIDHRGGGDDTTSSSDGDGGSSSRSRSR